MQAGSTHTLPNRVGMQAFPQPSYLCRPAGHCLLRRFPASCCRRCIAAAGHGVALRPLPRLGIKHLPLVPKLSCLQQEGVPQGC